MELDHFTQALLFGTCPYPNSVIAGRLERSLRALGDRAGLIREAWNKDIISALAYNLESRGLNHVFDDGEQQVLSAMREATAATQAQFLAVLARLHEDVGRDLRDLMVLKGLDLAYSVYPHPELRQMMDMDILVHREDLGLVRRALHDAGFIQGVLDHHRQEIVALPRAEIDRAERGHYECFPFRKLVRLPCLDGLLRPHSLLEPEEPFYLLGNEVWFSLDVDVHHSLAPDIDPADIWAGQRPASLGRVRLKGQSPEAMIWFLCARLYHEAMLRNDGGIAKLHDVAAILNRWGPELDWSKCLEVSFRYHLQPSLYYVLSRVRDLFDAPIPEHVLERLYPPHAGAASRLHDWGDFLPKMLGYFEMPALTFAD